MPIKQALGQLDELMVRAVTEEVFPGAAVAAGTSEAAAVRSYGVTTRLPGGAPVSAATRYDLASLSKLFTATAALILLEQGELRLDDPISRFLPAFQREDKRDLRLRHLLTHTSGLPAHRPYFQETTGRTGMLEAIARTPLEYATGTQVIYSCLGFIALAGVLEKIAGQQLDAFLAEWLFSPLGMHSTGYCPRQLTREQIAPTEFCPWRDRLVWGEVHDENAYAQGGVSGNAGVFSTASDLIIFAQMMLRRGAARGRHILSPATVQLATRNHTPGLQENRGLGWQLPSKEYPWGGDLAAANSYGHTGFTGTSLWISPDDDLFVILLSNRVHPTRANTQHIRYRPLIHNRLISALNRRSGVIGS